MDQNVHKEHGFGHTQHYYYLAADCLQLKLNMNVMNVTCIIYLYHIQWQGQVL